jgi:hypothetical protein
LKHRLALDTKSGTTARQLTTEKIMKTLSMAPNQWFQNINKGLLTSKRKKAFTMFTAKGCIPVQTRMLINMSDHSFMLLAAQVRTLTMEHSFSHQSAMRGSMPLKKASL